MSNLIDSFISSKQSDGYDGPDPSLDGASEDDGSGNSSVSSFFNSLADTYKTVNGALNDHNASTSPGTAVQSPAAEKIMNWIPWAIGGTVVLVVAFLYFRK